MKERLAGLGASLCCQRASHEEQRIAGQERKNDDSGFGEDYEKENQVC